MTQDLFKPAKKSQATMFVVTGIIILAVIMLYIFLSFIAKRTPDIESTVSVQEQSKQVRSYAESCLKDLFEDSLINTGIQGGYFNLPDIYFKNDFLRVAYAYNKKPVLLTKESLKKEISSYIISKLTKYCTFREFKGLRIDTSQMNPEILLENNSTLLNPNFIITISKRRETIQLKDFKIRVNVRLNLIYDLISLILQDLHRSNINIPEGIKIKIIQYDNDLLYLIFDENSIIKDSQYKFLFALKE